MNILVIGGGSIGKRHIKNLQAFGYTNIYCLKRSVDKEFENENKIQVVTSYEEAEKFKINHVFVCNPTSLHLEGLKFAKKINAHVFMEKPLIHSEKGLMDAIEMMKDFKNVFFIGFMLRFHPLVIKIKEIIDSKELGDVYSARFEFGSYLPYWHPWEDHKTGYAAKKELGGGVINTITHELDLIQYFFSSPSSVTCHSSNLGKLGIDVEEQADAIFEYQDKTVTLHLDYFQKDYDRNIKLLFEEGKLIWDWHTNKIEIISHKDGKKTIDLNSDFQVNDLYVKELKAYFELANQKTIAHPLDFNHAIINTRIMLAMHASGKENKKIILQ